VGGRHQSTERDEEKEIRLGWVGGERCQDFIRGRASLPGETSSLRSSPCQKDKRTRGERRDQN